MTLGTLTLIILGLAYLVWSYYSIKDLMGNTYNASIKTCFWCAITLITFGFILVSYLADNWERDLLCL